MKYIISALLALTTASLLAQDSSKVEITSSFFLDSYYSNHLKYKYLINELEFQLVDDLENKGEHLFNHNSLNTMSLNLALAQFSAESDDFHANLGLMMGDYVSYNLSGEPSALRNIYEAYGGFKAGKIWVDVGVFSSNLGFESAISTDNITLTRSLVAESSPYYLSGIRVTYQPNDKWTFLGVISNGWQLMRDNNKYKAIGTQITFSPNDKFSFNHSTFIGDESESGYHNRYFNNFYVIAKLGEKVNLIACVDYGMQNNQSSMDTWIGLASLMQIMINEKVNIGLRGEYYGDDSGVILPTFDMYTTINNLSSASVNVDYKINDFSTFRTELRQFTYKTSFGDEVFFPVDIHFNDYYLTTSLAFNF